MDAPTLNGLVQGPKLDKTALRLLCLFTALLMNVAMAGLPQSNTGIVVLKSGHHNGITHHNEISMASSYCP